MAKYNLLMYLISFQKEYFKKYFSKINQEHEALIEDGIDDEMVHSAFATFILEILGKNYSYISHVKIKSENTN